MGRQLPGLERPNTLCSSPSTTHTGPATSPRGRQRPHLGWIMQVERVVEAKVDEAQQGGVELGEGGHHAVIHIRGVLRAGREGENTRMKDRIPSSGAGSWSPSTSLGHEAAGRSGHKSRCSLAPSADGGRSCPLHSQV